MNQSEFQDLVKVLCSVDSSSVLRAATSLHKLTVTKEIQDFDWTSSLFDSIWRALHNCWLKASSLLIKEDVLNIWKIEKLLVDTFSIIIGFPEFESRTAAESHFICREMLQALFKRVLIASPSLLSVQHFLHWIYQNRVDLRSTIRIMLCSALLAETTPDPNKKKGRYKDGGKGRDHVGPMLELLLCIVEGFSFSPQVSCKAVLINVLMPLHQPNEMVEWRDQIPVLQLYHRQLMRCVQAVIEKSRTSENASAASTLPGCSVVSNQQQEPLLVTAVRGLLSFWPPSHSANTPKEILMMHELEGLVLMATVSCSSSNGTRSSSGSAPRGESEFLAVLPMFLKKVASALGKVGDSDNFRTSQRALQTFKNKALLLLLAEQHHLDNETEKKREPVDGGNATVVSPALSSVFSALIPALYRGGQLSWNPTVNKMTALALRNLKALDEDLFRRCCDRCLSTPLDGASRSVSSCDTDCADRTGRGQGHPIDGRKGVSADAVGGGRSVADAIGGDASRLSLESDPKSPPSQTHLNKKMRPPLPAQDAIFEPPSALGPRTVPPCFQVQLCPQSLSSMRQQSTEGSSYPLTVTGIAPWAAPLKLTSTATAVAPGRAMKETGCRGSGPPAPLFLAQPPPKFSVSTCMPPSGRPPTLPLKGAERSQRPTLDQVPSLAADSALSTSSEGAGEGEGGAGAGGYERLLDFMERCLPSQKDAGGGASEDDWRAAQTALTPTLLPTLRFHDLVFGGELGKGSFGTVKYSRKICRGRPRSEWPEYAVKIVSADTMSKEGYKGSVVREMAVLQMVAHPGFSRLVSSFRYTHSAYLVLEYAGGGDLHSLVIIASPRGPVPAPLSHLCTRFILGEIVAALLSLHAIGLSYNDLKPENILVTSSGHIKIADFGACRAFTASAKEALEGAVKALSGGTALRNGDWKDGPDEDPEASGDLDFSAVEVDDRLEGTPAYMPPELLRGIGGDGQEPGLSDAWALGCVASFCLRGRPLYLGSAKEVLLQMESEERLDSQVHFSIWKENREGESEREIEGDRDEGIDSCGTEQSVSELFMSSLLCKDPRNRLTLEQAAVHTYLLHGHSPRDGSLSMDPLTLHQSTPPVALPVRSKDSAGAGGADSHDEHLWARRQFSVLWAPMPSDGTAAQQQTEEGSQGGVLSSFLSPYRMDAIEETELERLSPFLL